MMHAAPEARQICSALSALLFFTVGAKNARLDAFRPVVVVVGDSVALVQEDKTDATLRDPKDAWHHPSVTPPRKPSDVPALALPVEQAAESLGLSQSHFRQHVLPHVRSIKVGRVRIVPVIELERWLYLSGRFEDED